MPELEIPDVLTEVTAEWLTAALGQNGLQTRVSSLRSEPIGEGTGMNGTTARIIPQYAPGASPGPESFVIKLPATSPFNRELGIRLGFYQNEVRFYEDLAEGVGIRVPRRYYSGMDVEAKKFALLMEDLAPAQVGDDLNGCTLAEAELAVSELARFNALWWDSPALEKVAWLPTVEPDIASAQARFQEMIWPGVLKRAGNTMPSEAIEIFGGLVEHLVEVYSQLGEPPVVLSHTDYRLVNMLFGDTSNKPTVAVVDWQRVAKAKGPVDLAYFLLLSHTTEERRAREPHLVQVYHDTLVGSGIKGYSLDQCWNDYRLGAFSPSRLALAFSSRPEMDVGNEQGKLLQTALLERVVAAAVDLKLGEFIPR